MLNDISGGPVNKTKNGSDHACFATSTWAQKGKDLICRNGKIYVHQSLNSLAFREKTLANIVNADLHGSLSKRSRDGKNCASGPLNFYNNLVKTFLWHIENFPEFASPFTNFVIRKLPNGQDFCFVNAVNRGIDAGMEYIFTNLIGQHLHGIFR